MKTNPSQNENENLFVNIDNLDAPSNMNEVYVPKSNTVEDEEDLPSLNTSLNSDDLMNIISREKKIHKDNYEDPIRMYLKEIGDVKLLSRKDEEILARTIDLKYQYQNLTTELEETEPGIVTSVDLVIEVINRINTFYSIMKSISEYYGGPKQITLNDLIQTDSHVNKIHGVYEDALIAYLSDKNNISKENLQSIYKETRRIRDTVHTSIEKRCNNLSMGMSNDYEIAILEGATHIRLGTALFGKRPQ